MRYKNHLLLLLTAFIWGCAFVAQSAGMDYVGPFTFTALRSYLGGLVLLPLFISLIIQWTSRIRNYGQVELPVVLY